MNEQKNSKHFQKAEDYLAKEKPKQALRYFKMCYDHFSNISDIKNSALCLYQISICYFEMNKFSLSIENLKLAKELLDDCNDNILRLKYLIPKAIGLVYITNGEYKKSIEWFQLAKDEILKSNNYLPADLAEIYNSLGGLYHNYYDFEKAFDMFSLAINIIEGKCKDGYDKLSLYYNNLGNLFNSAIRLSVKSGTKYFPGDGFGYFKKALFYVNKYPPFAHKTHIANIYNNMALFCGLTSKPNKELIYLNKSKKAFAYAGGDNRYYISILYVNYGNYYFRKSKFDKAREYFRKSVTIRKEILGIKSSLLVKNYLYIGDCFYYQSKYVNAVNYYQKALNIASLGSYEKSYLKNPAVENVTFLPELISVLFNKAKVLRCLYYQKNDISYLYASLDCYLVLSRLFGNIRKNLTNIESKVILSSKILSIFEYAIETTVEILDLTGNDQYSGYAFEFSESSKAIVLLEDLTDLEAKTSSEIPSHLIEEETKLKDDIGYYQKMLFEEKSKKFGKSKISELSNNLYNSKQKLDELIENFEKKYKNYYDFKYNYKTTIVKEIQKTIKQGEIVIEYFLGDEFLFIFRITKDDYSVSKITKSKSFDAKLKRFRKCLTLENEGIKNDFNEFVSLSHYFYKILLKNSLSSGSFSKIIIIPDGMLNYIPFEVLITEKPESNDSFRTISYLLEKYDVRYSYSSTLLMRYINLKKNRKRKDLKVLGFAPSFKKSKNVPENEDSLRSGLSNLKWNVKELKNTRKYFKSTLYTGSRAGKKAFVEKAGLYTVLHLATHGIVEDQNPMFSKIAFTPAKNSVDDGYLHTYELYNMKIDSELTILSACDTGYGRLVKGEGVMSIARGFLYAGSKSIMMSLWQVSDFATCKIVDYFYKGLSEGMSKDEALRKAKLRYIKSSDTIKSNPSFWAPFVLIGNADPLT